MGFVRQLTGKNQAQAAEDAANIQAASAQSAIARQEAARETAQQFLSPFAEVGQRGIEQAGFLADPQAQFEFLQENPLFDLALQNVNRQTLGSAAARGRLSAGDTLEQLAGNVLLASQPLIAQQRQDIGNLLNLGTGIAGSQANIELGQAANIGGLLTDIGAAQAAGRVGSAAAKSGAAGNLFSLGANILGGQRAGDFASSLTGGGAVPAGAPVGQQVFGLGNQAGFGGTGALSTFGL